MSVKRRQHLFVVRMWSESATRPVSEDWHGLVQHVTSGQKLYFTDFTDLNSFIETQLEAGEASPEQSVETVVAVKSE